MLNLLLMLKKSRFYSTLLYTKDFFLILHCIFLSPFSCMSVVSVGIQKDTMKHTNLIFCKHCLWELYILHSHAFIFLRYSLIASVGPVNVLPQLGLQAYTVTYGSSQSYLQLPYLYKLLSQCDTDSCTDKTENKWLFLTHGFPGEPYENVPNI